jgi:3-deoxy-manno-octulosonate cytidylyltransferase (CMP-KDO synthetase)
MKAVAVIPARYGSTRFPAKPLANRTGKYLIQHVVENTLRATSLAAVVTATDDERIASAVRSFGGVAAMTRADHPSGTDRVAEVAADPGSPAFDADVIVNVQGDEPTLPPEYIDRLVRRMADDPGADMATLAAPFPADEPVDDPARVKVVLSRSGRALYFSRSVIPRVRDARDGGRPPGLHLLHLGIYAYRRAFLLGIAELQPTPLELAEKLEQLRVLEHGAAIAVEVVPRPTQGIDTPEQYEAFVESVRSPKSEVRSPK